MSDARDQSQYRIQYGLNNGDLIHCLSSSASLIVSMIAVISAKDFRPLITVVPLLLEDSSSRGGGKTGGE